MPDIVDMAIAFAIPDFSEPTFKMQGAAGLIVGDNLCLQCPIGFRFRGSDERRQKRGADPLAKSIRCNIDADLSDTGGTSGVGDRRQSRPSRNLAVSGFGNETPRFQMPVIPVRPVARIGGEGS